ncbi:MAG: HAD-IB family hydrolase [Pseudomonadota bacterium]
MQLYDKVIKEVEQSPEGPQIGAFFDFDGTIIYGYSATTYLREQIRRGDVKPRQLVEIIGTMTNFGLGNMGFSQMMAQTSKYLKGIEEKDYIEFGEKLYKKHIAKLIYPESRALIEAHLKKGHTVALISAATPYQVTAAAKELGIPHVKCTRLETIGGRFTGKVIKPTCYGMGKVAAAEELVERYDVKPEESFFYSDSDEDIQLLEYVGKPRPLNPNSRLRGIARGRGWPVQDFNSRGKVGIKDYLRTFATQGSMVGSFLAGIPMYGLTGSLAKSRNFSTSLFADLATAITGIELDVTGEEHVWTNRPCVFIFNHQSQADTIILPALLRRDMAGVGKKEIGDVPILGQIMKFGGTVLIDRENTASAKEAMKPLVDVMRLEGRSVCIAPEGTRSTSTNMGRFKKGAFHLALQAQVPIVPIVIHNAIDVAPRGQFVMRPATVKITVLPPIDTSSWTVETIDQHVDAVRDMFLVELDQMEIQGEQSGKESKHPTKSSVARLTVVKSEPNPAPKESKKAGVTKTRRKAVKKSSTRKTGTAKKKASRSASQTAKKVASKVGKKVAKSAGKVAKKAAKAAVGKAVKKPEKKTTEAAPKATYRTRRSRKKTPVVKVSAKQVNDESASLIEAKPVKAAKAAKKTGTKKSTAAKKRTTSRGKTKTTAKTQKQSAKTG